MMTGPERDDCDHGTACEEPYDRTADHYASKTCFMVCSSFSDGEAPFSSLPSQLVEMPSVWARSERVCPLATRWATSRPCSPSSTVSRARLLSASEPATRTP